MLISGLAWMIPLKIRPGSQMPLLQKDPASFTFERWSTFVQRHPNSAPLETERNETKDYVFSRLAQCLLADLRIRLLRQYVRPGCQTVGTNDHSLRSLTSFGSHD
jgi:hypothetical protein